MIYKLKRDKVEKINTLMPYFYQFKTTEEEEFCTISDVDAEIFSKNTKVLESEDIPLYNSADQTARALSNDELDFIPYLQSIAEDVLPDIFVDELAPVVMDAGELLELVPNLLNNGDSAELKGLYAGLRTDVDTNADDLNDVKAEVEDIKDGPQLVEINGQPHLGLRYGDYIVSDEKEMIFTEKNVTKNDWFETANGIVDYQLGYSFPMDILLTNFTCSYRSAKGDRDLYLYSDSSKSKIHTMTTTNSPVTSHKKYEKVIGKEKRIKIRADEKTETIKSAVFILKYRLILSTLV